MILALLEKGALFLNLFQHLHRMAGFLSLLLQCVALFCEGKSRFLIPDHLGLQGQKLLQKSRGCLFVQSSGPVKEVTCTRIQISSSFAGDQLFIGA
ncbi:hypothetical protein CO710_12125 [Acetobacter orleanensis]|nr:hypothetical protein CO710_12125 [Acetobacter orleanensis]